MSFQKHNWMKYGGQGAEILEITVKDGTGRKIDFFKVNNKEDSEKIGKIINKSYGFFPSFNKMTREKLKEEVEEELGFLKEHTSW